MPDTKERRAALLDAARATCEKARDEGRELTTAEGDQVNAALNEARAIDARNQADAKSHELLGKLDDMARGATTAGLLSGKRLSFAGMAEAAATKILAGSGYGEKAVAPSGATIVTQTLDADPVALGRPATSLLSVLPVTVLSSPQFSYLRQSVRTNNAAVVAEGAVKPTSIYSVIRVDDQLDVVAHLSEAIPRFWLADSPQLSAFLSTELQYGLQLAVEAKAIADIGSTSGIQTNAYSTSPLQTLRKSVTKLEANGYVPAAFVIHPLDWEATELAVASVNAIEHMSLPFDPVARRLWGVPITVSTAVAAGVAYTFAQGAVGMNTDSQGVQIAWSESSNADDWSKNLTRARCEGRYATSVFQPMGVIQSDLTA